MSNINIGISEQNREGVIQLLGRVLSDEYALYTKTRNYHWNVVGPHFNDYHKMFEEQYNALSDDIDDVAERIRSLGGKTPATLSEFVKNSRIDEHPGEYPDAEQMVKNLVSDHEKIIQAIRKDVAECGGKYGDVGTEDFLTGLMEKHEKTAWMIRSMLEE